MYHICPTQCHTTISSSGSFARPDTFILVQIHFILYQRLAVQLYQLSHNFHQLHTLAHTRPHTPSQTWPSIYIKKGERKKTSSETFRLIVVARIYSLRFLSAFLLDAERIRRRNATQKYKINIRVDLLLPPPFPPPRRSSSTLTHLSCASLSTLGSETK